jgi:hypothetical protein
MIQLLSALLLIANLAMADDIAEVGVTGTYQNNAFYEDENINGDFVMSIEPHLKWGDGSYKYGGNYFRFDGSYNKFVKFANLDYYDFDMEGQWAPLNNPKSVQWQFFADSALESDTAIDDESERRTRINYGGGTKLRFALSDTSSVTLWGHYKMQDQISTLFNHFDNTELNSGLFYNYWFLPETAINFGIEGGMKTYPNGKTPPADLDYSTKQSSVYAFPYVSVDGRLGPTTSAFAKAGYLYLDYEEAPFGQSNADFVEPKFEIKFEEQISARDVLSAGFDYLVYDTYFSNFILEQTIFLAYGRIIGDRILFLTRMGYSSLSYSLPTRREDQRIFGNFAVEYSVSRKLKLLGNFKVDILNSDSRDNFSTNGGNDPGEDPPMSYQSTHLGVTAKYVF